MAIEPKGPAPYAPAQTVIDLLEGYRNRGFATPFTPEVLQKASIPDSLVNRTLQTFRLFDLIDDKGNPTDQLVAFKEARGDDEYKSCLQSWLTSIYTDVLKYADPATDEQKKVSEAFRGYTPEGQRGRMVTLMIGLFAYAGLIEEPPKRPASPKANRTTKNAAGRGTAGDFESHAGRDGKFNFRYARFKSVRSLSKIWRWVAFAVCGRRALSRRQAEGNGLEPEFGQGMNACCSSFRKNDPFCLPISRCLIEGRCFAVPDNKK